MIEEKLNNKLPYNILKKDITLFFRAVLDGAKDKIEKLLANGVDLTTTDSKGRNAAFYAVIGGKLDTLKLLIQKGLSADFIDPVTGDSLLHVASSERHMHILYYLVNECHVDVNIKNKRNRTVLYDCLVFTQMQTAWFLIENGAERTGELPHEEALYRYLDSAREMMLYDWLQKGLVGETLAKQRKVVTDFMSQCSCYKEVSNNKKEGFGAEVESILHKVGITEQKEMDFYKKHLEPEQLPKMKTLKQIRNNLWECYFRNWVTRFYTTLDSKFMYPVYLLPFTPREVERDWHKQDGEGLDIASFINDVDTLLPEFGKDYYLIDKGYITIPHEENSGSFDDVKVVMSKKNIKGMGILEKYELMRKAWTHVEREENWIWYSRLCLNGAVKMAF